MARDSTKITPKATQTNKAATALSNLLTVRSQGTTNSRNMNSILPTVNIAIKIKATTRSNPTKNNQEMEEDPTVRNPTIKTIMVGEEEKTTWTRAHDIKSKVATKSSTRAAIKILVIREIRTKEVLLKMMTSKDMVDKSKVQATTVTKVIVKITTKVQDPSSPTKNLSTTTSKRGELQCKTLKSERSPRKTFTNPSLRVRFPNKVSVHLSILLLQENPK